MCYINLIYADYRFKTLNREFFIPKNSADFALLPLHGTFRGKKNLIWLSCTAFREVYNLVITD